MDVIKNATHLYVCMQVLELCPEREQKDVSVARCKIKHDSEKLL